MDRRRAAGLLLALAACFATATAAPTASNHSAIDLYHGAPEGCYYNFQHYGEGDRIMTNEPCLNCTCHNRMLMCYLRVCPFTKPIGQDCTIEKRADQCCPIVTCPDVPVDLLTSTTTSPAEYGPTGIGKLDKFGCSINGKYFSEGSKVPPTPNKPCEHCYCIRNMTTCVMQECTLHVDGCTPIYHKDVCCPVRYSCDHPEDEMPLLDDLSTTVRPTPGFLLTTTTISPVTQMSQDCVYDNRIFPDGALIKTEKACDHCYCMKGDIVCVVQECGTPMENEGKNCTALSPREGVCCPDTYICEGDEPSTSSTETYEKDEFTTHAVQDKLTTWSPPRRTSSEGSGYRNEPDEVPYTEPSVLDQEVEGSGEDEEQKQPDVITTEKVKPELPNDILASTEETHEFIPLTTTKPKEEEETKVEVTKEDESLVSTVHIEQTTEYQQHLPSTTGIYTTKEFEEPITDKVEDIGSGELPEDIDSKPHEKDHIEENVVTTEIYEQNIVTSGITDQDSSELVTSGPYTKEENTDKPLIQNAVSSDIGDSTTSISNIEQDVTAATVPVVEDDTNGSVATKSPQISEETATKHLEFSDLTTQHTPIVDEEEVKLTTKFDEQNAVTSIPDDFVKEDDIATQHHLSSTSAPSLDDEFVTTEAQELFTDRIKETEIYEPQHVTASTPMLEEIENNTTEYTEPKPDIPGGASQDDDRFNIVSTTTSNVPKTESKKDVTESSVSEENITEDYLAVTTNIPVFDKQEETTAGFENIPKESIDTSVKESSESEKHSTPTTTSSLIDNERKTTSDLEITVSEYYSEKHEAGFSTTVSTLDTEKATTEPDKGLNTIPSEGIEKEITVSPEIQKPTTTEEKITTGAGIDKFSTETEDIISSTTLSTSVSKEESPLLTTESAFRKEDYSPTEAQISPKSPTVTADVTEEVISTLTHDHTESTNAVSDPKHETETTLEPKYTENIEETTQAKETSISEMITEKSTTSIPLEKETTTANQEDNEIFNEPRIPGEGDCLLNGVTYTNESAVPSTNKCQSGCKCISSIIKCDPIICSPPPEYMNNCETMYDTPDACCPTYICDHKTETIPPQSHSQMSGTEAPVISPVHCHDNECEINKDQKPHEETSNACESGSCAGSSDEPKETPSYSHSENIPENPPLVQNEDCVGDECKQVLCTGENGCQATPVQPCEGEKCDILPGVGLPPETQQCAYGEDCSASNVPPKECIGDNCDAPGTRPAEACTGSEGCLNVPQLSEEECKEDNCRRKGSSPLDQHVSEPCTTSDCKPTQTDMETSVVPSSEPTSHVIDEDNRKDITETTEKLESITEPSEQTHSDVTTDLPEAHEIVTKPPEITREESSTTVSDIIELVTKSKPEISTESSEYPDDKEVTSSDTNEPLYTESPGYQTSISPGTTKKDSDEHITSPLGDVEMETTDKSITEKETSATERPQEYGTEKSTTEKIFDVNEPTKIYTPESPPEPSDKLKPEDETTLQEEGSGTEPSVPFTMDSEKNTDIKDETITDIAIDSSTEPAKPEGDMKEPSISEHADTTTAFAQESSTEPSKTFSTEREEVTEASHETEPTKSTGGVKDETESTSIDTKEQVEEIDHKTTVMPSAYDDTTVSAITNDLQSITVSKTPEATYLPEETAHKGTPSEVTETPATEQTTKTSESQDQEVTTDKVLDISTTESFTYSNGKQQEITPSQESKETTAEVHESVTLPAVPQTETQLDTKSPEEIERDSSTIAETGTTQSYATEPKATENMYQQETTSKVIEESSSEPSKIDDGENQAITQSSEKPEHKDSTPTISEDSNEISVTDFSTEPINVYPIETDEDNKSPVETDQDTTTDNVLDEHVTGPPTPFNTEPEISKLPEESTTSKPSQPSEPSLSYTTESQDLPKSPEESYTTTVKAFTESASELPKAEDEVKTELGTLKPITDETFVEIPETTTTSQEVSSKLNEFTTASSISSTKITTQQEEISEKTTNIPISDIESKLPQTDGSIQTESSIKEQFSATPGPTDYDIPITATTLAIDSDQTQYAESTPKGLEQETQKSDLETQTASSQTSAPEVSEPEATQQPEKATAIEKDVTQQVDTEIQVPAIEPTETDELRTTISEIQELTTSKPIEASQLPHAVEEKTEYPEITYTTQHEDKTENVDGGSQEAFTKETSTGTEKVIIPEILSTDKPAEANPDSTTEIESGTEPQISSESKPSIEESYTKEPITKYSSPEPTAEYESTKPYPDENTIEPLYHDSKEPEKPVDGLIQSLVTEQYESTKPSDLEKDSRTQTPIQISSTTPENVKQTPQQDNASDELTTPPSISADTTPKEVVAIVTSTEYDKSVKEDIQTQSPSDVDKTESETTTQKKLLTEDTTQELSMTEQNEFISSATEHVTTPKHLDTPVFDVTTETSEQDMPFTEKQELAPSNKPSVGMYEPSTESSYTTEISDKVTVSALDITNISDIQLPTETSAQESPETPSEIETPTSKPVSEKYDSTSEDQQTTESLEAGKKPSELTTLEPSAVTQLYTPFESTVAPKQEYSEGSSSPLEETTDKTVTEEHATESASSESFTEKQPEILQTVIPEKQTPVEEFVPISSKQPEPEIYQTTEPATQNISEMSTSPSVALEEESTTLSHDIDKKPPTEEQSIPVVISETEKTSTPEESIAVQTERIIPASDKPIYETTAPEEEFIVATSKATTVKVDEEISTLSPSVDRTAKPTDTSSESYSSTTPEAFVTDASDELASEKPITTAPDAFVTSIPEAPVTKTPDEPITPEALATETPGTPLITVPEVTSSEVPEAPITNEPKEPIAAEPEAPITAASEAPITAAPEVPITGAPEAPISTASEEVITAAPEAPMTAAPEAPITSAPEAAITAVPEAPITAGPETPIVAPPEEVTTVASEAPFTNVPEDTKSPITNAPEAPTTSAPETPEGPITNAPETAITSAPETPEEPITNAPETPTTSAPEELVTNVPEAPITSAPSVPEAPISSTSDLTKDTPISNAPETPITNAPESPITSAPEVPEPAITSAPEVPETPITSAPEVPETPISRAPEAPITSAPELPVTALPELPKPVSTEAQPTDEVPTPDEEGSFPPSAGTSGYGQEPDYVEEDQTFGPGTCRYGGKVYVSAQQIPRDDPCDFCFCFRSDIICLQQSCPPPIHGCHEEPIQGFCCPRYECPVSMATTVNVTTTTTTTTTTLPPHFPTHSYKGSVQKRGCQIKGQTYKVGEVVRASSGPCLHCTCGGDGQMKCDPKVCTPEPMLRQMIAAAVSAKRRR